MLIYIYIYLYSIVISLCYALPGLTKCTKITNICNIFQMSTCFFGFCSCHVKISTQFITDLVIFIIYKNPFPYMLVSIQLLANHTFFIHILYCDYRLSIFFNEKLTTYENLCIQFQSILTQQIIFNPHFAKKISQKQLKYFENFQRKYKTII